MRKLKIANSNKRDAEIIFGGLPKKRAYHYVLPDGSEPVNRKVLKATIETQYDALLKKYELDEALAEAIIEGDPEIDFGLTGKFVKDSHRMLVNPSHQPIYKVDVKEEVFAPDGSLTEEKDHIDRNQNIMTEVPIKWTGKYMPIEEAYNRFIFVKKYQLTHDSGLTYDFLYDMAKELHDKKSFMLVGGGKKGNEPLIFQENGKPYRAFLEGRVKDDAYLLLLHLSNMELKPILE